MAKESKNKGSDQFTEAIKSHLDTLAYADEDFRETYANPKKSIESCCNYIIEEVKKTNRVGFDDKEIFDLAEDYYNSDKTSVKSTNKPHIAVNHQIELSESEKEEAKAEAKAAVIKAEMDRIKKIGKKPIKKVEQKEVTQGDLFE